MQYYEHGSGAIHNLVDLRQIPLRAPNLNKPTTLDTVVKRQARNQTPPKSITIRFSASTDVYVTPSGEDLGA